MGIFRRKIKIIEGLMVTDSAGIEHLSNVTFDREQEVVGESFHQREIEAVVGVTESGHPIHSTLLAVVQPEPNNPHDKRAIVVMLGGVPCGHIPRDEQARIRRIFKKLGKDQIVCQARIVGRKGTKEDPYSLGVWLDLGSPKTTESA